MNIINLYKRVSPLAKRMVFFVVIASTVITLFTSSFQLYETYKVNISGIEVRIKEVRDSQSKIISEMLWVSNQKDLNTVLEGILLLPDIEYIEVYEGEELIAKHGGIPKGDKIEDDFPLLYMFRGEEKKIGRFHLEASLAGTYDHLYNQAITIIVSNAVKTFFISSFMLYLFYTLVARDLISLGLFAKKINVDSLQNKLELKRKLKHASMDEVDTLGVTLIELQERLRESIIEVKEKELEQREILSSIMDAVITINEKYEILSFNNMAEKTFGFNEGEILGESLLRLIPESYEQKHEEGLSHYIQTNQATIIGLESGTDLEGMKKDGSIFPIRLSIAELPKDRNGLRRFIATCQDLSQIKQQEEQLRRSQKMEALGKLTGGIAHDYNNMLSVILGYSELLADELAEQPKLLSFTDEIFHASERGAKLTKKLLSFSRKTMSFNETVNLNEILLSELDMLEKTLTARIKLIFELSDDIWCVKLDRSEFEDVVLNLSINAMHAIENNGSLTIKTSNTYIGESESNVFQLQPGEYVLLTITDTGIGMDDETKEKIFEPFFSTKGENGTGLGLSQVYGFIERCNGAIKVTSEVGVGTSFSLYFPRDTENNENKDNIIDVELKNNNSLLGNEAILIVDDELGLRNLTSEMLRINGYKVFSAEDGEKALDILKDNTIDLVLSDVIMPNMDGFQLARVVKEKYPSIIIQLVSGFSDELGDAEEDKELSENLLAKPYNSQCLLTRLRELLD